MGKVEFHVESEPVKVSTEGDPIVMSVLTSAERFPDGSWFFGEAIISLPPGAKLYERVKSPEGESPTEARQSPK